MAVTVISKPSSPNAAYTKLLFEVSSSNSSQPQFQYVYDIYLSGSSDRITRAYSKGNNDGNGLFDIAPVLQDQLTYDNNWKITNSSSLDTSLQTFDIKVGEVYGTSISSSVTIYPGSTSNLITVFPAVIDNVSEFNWPSGSNKLFTDYAGMKFLGPNDIETVTAYATGSSTLTVTYYDSASVSIGSIDYTIPADSFITVPIGSGSSTLYESASFINVLYGNEEVDYSLQEPYLDEKTRFAFINKYGTYDYFNAYSALKRNSTLEYNFVSLPKVDYSSTISTYSIENGGDTSYYTDINDDYAVDSGYLNKAEAQWLEQLVESPEVYVQQGNDFVPINISNTAYTADTSENRQKTFQYTFEFSPSNGRDIYALSVSPGVPPVNPIIPPGVPSSSLFYSFNAVNTFDEEIRATLPTLKVSGSGSIYANIPIEKTNFTGLQVRSEDVRWAETDYFFSESFAIDSGTLNNHYIIQNAVYQNQEELYFSESINTGTSLSHSLDVPITKRVASITYQTKLYNPLTLWYNWKPGSNIDYGINTTVDLLNGSNPTEMKTALMYQLSPLNTSSFYYDKRVGLEVGTQLRDENFLPYTGSGYLLDTALHYNSGSTYMFVNQARVGVDAGTVYTISTGSVSAITGIQDYNDVTSSITGLYRGVTMAQNVPFSYKFKTAAYNYNMFDVWSYPNTYAVIDSATNEITTRIYDANVPPGAGYFLYKHLPQNSPQATLRRDVNWTDPGVTFNNSTIISASLGIISSSVEYVNWNWRGYQFNGDSGSNVPNYVNNLDDAATYTGSLDCIAFAYGKLAPGARLYLAPSTSSIGYGPITGSGGFNTWFTIDLDDPLFNDTDQRTRYACQIDTDGYITQLKKEKNFNVEGPRAGRWRGPYLWLNEGQADEFRGCAISSSFNTAVYIDPAGGLDSVKVGTLVYTDFNSGSFTYSNLFNGENKFYQMHDYNPDWDNVPNPDNGKVLRINSSGSVTYVAGCDFPPFTCYISASVSDVPCGIF